MNSTVLWFFALGIGRINAGDLNAGVRWSRAGLDWMHYMGFPNGPFSWQISGMGFDALHAVEQNRIREARNVGDYLWR